MSDPVIARDVAWLILIYIAALVIMFRDAYESD